MDEDYEPGRIIKQRKGSKALAGESQPVGLRGLKRTPQTVPTYTRRRLWGRWNFG